MRSLPPTHREAIRAIFLKRRSEYTTREAAQLLRLNLGEVLAWIKDGTLHVEHKRKRRQLGGPRHAMVPWKELASAALMRWTVMQIHDALGRDADRVLPRLLQPEELKAIRLPAYQVRLLETLAQNSGVNPEDYLCAALMNLETMGSPEEMERLLPGLRAAIEFPDV